MWLQTHSQRRMSNKLLSCQRKNAASVQQGIQQIITTDEIKEYLKQMGFEIVFIGRMYLWI